MDHVQFSFGPNNAYFVKCDSMRAWYGLNLPYKVSPPITRNRSDKNTLPEPLRHVLQDPNHAEYCKFPYDVAMAMEPGVYSMWWLAKNDIEYYEPDHLGPHYAKLAAFIAAGKTSRTVFGPQRSYFSSSSTGLSWQNLPASLETDITNRLKLGRPHTVALGVGGTWVTLYDDSQLSWILSEQYPGLQVFLDNAEERNKRNSIVYVALSPYVAGQYFVVFGNGTAQWNLPREMHADVETVVKAMRPLAQAAGARSPDGMLQATLNFQLAAHTNQVMNNFWFHNR
ncbi:hypothetical protein R3P38DRAFT_1353669 [Favolaschia claudopus]|uniref:Uncharacterized protein n=1 Tax=Favolaschia claudopus TaxID=2862362 RepID=A0AAW0DTZ3_9AGAR